MRGMTALEASPPKLTAAPDVGQIALACLLGYRDLRFNETWRKEYPKLHAWHDKFAAQVPAFAETKMQPT
jgi:glutathione S-transferase